MKILLTILWFLIFAKLLLFWLWLWQLKEYHWGRFKAHFETQAVKKILSSFWRLKYPKFTKKMFILLLLGLLCEIVFLIASINLSSILTFPDPQGFFMPGFNSAALYSDLLIALIFAPAIASLLVLLLQIPTVIMRKQILKKAQRKKEGFKDLVVIGITGSYGKTSTKEFLYTILREKFGDKVLKTKEHINAEIGIAKTILRELNENHKIFIAEIGAYERGKIKEVCRMLKPHIGILTGINEQHLSTFGSQENIIKAKLELIEALPEQGIAILNGDNEFILNLKSKILNLHLKSKIFCSIKEKAGIWTKNIKAEKETVSFKAMNRVGESADFRVSVLGEHNVIDILMVAACAQELGMSLAEIAKASEKIKSPVQVKKSAGGLNIIDSTYSANPNGVIAHLEYLKTAWPEAKKIIVMPCLIELGRASKEVHYRVGQKIGEVCDLAIITTKDRFKELKQGTLSARMKDDQIVLIEKPRQILEKIKTTVTSDDVILLESRVPNGLKDSLIKN